jgi:hypothetical protein
VIRRLRRIAADKFAEIAEVAADPAASPSDEMRPPRMRLFAKFSALADQTNQHAPAFGTE